MWTCIKCGRLFKRVEQPHSCSKVPLESHFKNKEKAKELFDYLLKSIDEKIGKTKTISLPCCIHLFASYDFLAALPKKNSLEIRIGLERKLESSRVIASVPLSSKGYKYCFEIKSFKDINNEFLGWIKESYLRT